MARKELKQAKRRVRRAFPRRRRAMVLLVVLSLLAIFTLITVSFVLIASQGRVTSMAAARAEWRGDEPKSLLHEAMLQLVRGSRNPASILQAHSLLEDIYGNDGVTGTVVRYVDNVPPRANNGSGAIFETEIVIDPLYLPAPANDPFGMVSRYTQRGCFNGCVLTMLDGPLRGKSTRIVDSAPPPAAAPPLPPPPVGVLRLRLQSFGDGLDAQLSVAANQRFVINGRAFNGTGFGLARYSGGSRFKTMPVTNKLQPLLEVQDQELMALFQPSGSTREWPRALLPNHVMAAIDNSYHGPYPTLAGQFFFDPAGPGGADEPYDAVDYQNLHMAMHYWDFTTNSMRTPLPSFHRPDLLNYLWGPGSRSGPELRNDTLQDVIRRAMAEPGKAGILRKAMLRPNAIDHPNFPGNNPATLPAFHPVYGYGTIAQPEWDVDNDSDGKRDSIWIDIGLPAQTMPDGRWYKPLVAVLCVDMDGRLNLNAHGNANHIALAKHFETSATDPTLANVAGPFAGTSGSINAPTALLGGQRYALHFGQGYGPAEVNLRRVLPIDPNTGIDPLMNLLGGNYGLEGRYGELRSSTRGAASFIRPGVTNDYVNVGSIPAGRLTLKNLDQMDVPAKYADALLNQLTGDPLARPMLANNYGTPMDLDGDGMLALDHRGVPFYASVPSTYRIGPHGAGEDFEMFNDPYELDLSKSAGGSWLSQSGSSTHPSLTPVDAPFTPEELERYLRAYDADTDSINSGSGSTLPSRASRMVELAPRLIADPSMQALFTTTSWDVPAAGITVGIDNLVQINAPASTEPKRYPTPRVQGVSIVDLLAARLRARNPSITDAAINDAANELLAPELLAGRKMDLNRPFGNGRDDNGNGIVDEPDEYQSESSMFPTRNLGRAGVTAQLDLNYDGVINGGEKLARQNYAKQLYVLMMLLMDDQFRQTQTAWTAQQGASGPREEVARRVAQWAVNVVDFRDRDSSMTGFEFDVDPFATNVAATAGPGTWNVDGDLTTNEGNHRLVVWGTERPELLITEVIATHDRRTEDTTAFDGHKQGTGDQDDDDEDYDQIRRPVGTLAIELYNPGGYWDAASELTGVDSTGGRGIDLTAVSKPNPLYPGRSPIWRVVTHRSQMLGGNPPPPLDHPDHHLPVLPTAAIDRIAYFTASNQPGVDSPNPAPARVPVFHREANFDVRMIRPGGYAIVAPAGAVDLQGDPAAAARRYRTFFGDRLNPTTRENRYPFFLHFENGYAEPRRQGVPQEFPLAADQQPAGFILDNVTRQGGSRMLRFSISEPNDGYPIPPAARQTLPNHPDDFFIAGQEVDTPYDLQYHTDPVAQTTIQKDGYDNNNEAGSSMVYLERLADPSRPWHADANPYITIDRAFVDLRTYNGEQDPSHAGARGEEIGNNIFVSDHEVFDSFRRGAESGAADPARAAVRNIWSPLTAPDSGSDVMSELPANASSPDRPCTHSTFGYLNGYATANKEFGPGITPAANLTMPTPSGAPFKFAGSPATSPANPTAPADTFPWLTWNNRPFTSAIELLMVPATTPPGLLVEHGVANATIANDVYSVDATTGPSRAPYQDLFRHLQNFFNSASVRGEAQEFYRLFDYVEVPSRYAGTTDSLDAAEFTGGDHRLNPPFNKLSRFREPGKINLNTVFDPRVWDALTDGAFGLSTNPALPERWDDLYLSRQGYGGPMAGINVNYPTMFSNPFRPAGTNPFVPQVPRPKNGGIPDPNGTPDAADPTGLMQSRDVNVTLFRRRRWNNNNPLLTMPDPADTLVSASVDSKRNPYFRYAGLEKIYNSVTTRSNVYAIWITVGYFEVTPAPIGPTHPDGWQLGPEIGTDTGEIQRHRAFYLYDRTIPVGFQRGETLNVENGLLIQRYLE